MNPVAAPAALPALRANSLAIAFQDVITVVLRVRYRVQRVSDVAAFRDSIRKMIATAAQETRNLGYSDATSQMALYAIIGFLDESVLNSQDPAFQDWSRRPLQEEMFGGHFAGEYFFRHLNELLAQQNSHEGADILELHALCLLLGYRGKFAFGESGEIQNLLRRIREKIVQTRGSIVLCRVRDEQPVIAASPKDRWMKSLVFATIGIAALVLVAFAVFHIFLAGDLDAVQAQLHPLLLFHQPAILAISLGGLA